jgi:hypothetical protein
MLALTLALTLAVSAACGDGDPATAGLIDREVFIETFVELRLAAIRAGAFAVTPQERDEILGRHGVDADALLAFAGAHGGNPDYMTALWSEVDARLTARRDALVEDPR